MCAICTDSDHRSLARWMMFEIRVEPTVELAQWIVVRLIFIAFETRYCGFRQCCHSVWCDNRPFLSRHLCNEFNYAFSLWKKVIHVDTQWNEQWTRMHCVECAALVVVLHVSLSLSLFPLKKYNGISPATCRAQCTMRYVGILCVALLSGHYIRWRLITLNLI